MLDSLKLEIYVNVTIDPPKYPVYPKNLVAFDF
jgi:hypothetical protein